MKRENTADLSAAKATLRREMRAMLRGRQSEEQALASLEICRVLASLPAFRSAAVVAMFAPLESEPNIQPLMEEAWARNQRIVFPLMQSGGEAPALAWYEVKEEAELVLKAPFGPREPDPARCTCVGPEQVNIVLVPGLAFDARLQRLGRGGGYYDRALSLLAPEVPRVGVMFAIQQVQEVPSEAHDQKLTLVVSENGMTLPP